MLFIFIFSYPSLGFTQQVSEKIIEVKQLPTKNDRRQILEMMEECSTHLLITKCDLDLENPLLKELRIKN